MSRSLGFESELLTRDTRARGGLECLLDSAGNAMTEPRSVNADQLRDIGAASPRRLRVVHLYKGYPPVRGGIEGHVDLLTRLLANVGVDAEVLCALHTTSPFSTAISISVPPA